MPKKDSELVIQGLNNAKAFCLSERDFSLAVAPKAITAEQLLGFCQLINKIQADTLCLEDLEKHTEGTYTHKQALLDWS